MKKIAALILALVMLACAAALADTEEGVLRTAVGYDISTMDVAKTTDDYMIPMNIFDRLFETRRGNGSAEVVKSLAADYSVSEDGLTYTFTLRDGVVFSNGSPLTASDVQYTFERLLKMAKENTEIPLEVAGAEAVMNGEADTLAGFNVTDDTHFSITLSAPNGGFTAELSSPAMSIVDRESMDSCPNFGAEPAETIGSGPYKVTEWESGSHYTLVYNDKYWGEEPSVRKVIVKIVPAADTQNMMFSRGELDMLSLADLDSAIVAATYKSNPSARLVSAQKVGLTFLNMNEQNEFLKDVRVRKAIRMAIDVDAIIQGVFMGDAQRENGVIPFGVWGYNEALQPVAYDPEGAKQLLKEAGYAEGQITFELALDATANTSLQLVYNHVSQQLEAVGIKAVQNTYEHSTYLARRSSGTMDAYLARWGMDYNDPANIMYTFFGSEANVKNRCSNYADKDVIARVAAARSIVDDEARKAEYQALEKKLIEEDTAWVPLYTELRLWALGDRVESFTPQWAGFTDFFAIDVKLK